LVEGILNAHAETHLNMAVFMVNHNVKKPLQKNHQKIIKTVSTYLRELRYNENLTQNQVSEETGLHRNTLGNIENSKPCSIKSILILCDFYQISPAYLFSIIDE
jgi:DNA-binding XRE family transcriptional regulator